MGFFSRLFAGQAKKDMYHDAGYTGRDRAGNHWYMPNWVRNLFNDSNAYQNEYDLTTMEGKHQALRLCFPFSSVVDRCGKMMMNGKFYVTDSKGNEKNGPKYKEIRGLLEKPNNMQNGRSFLYEVETNLRAYGFCPLYLLRLGWETPEAIVPIPPYIFHIEGTGRHFAQTDRKEIIKRAYIKWGDSETSLEDNEYAVIVDSIPVFGTQDGDEITFQSGVDSLSPFARNFMSAVIARGNLIVNGGPKGVLYGNDTSDVGNAALTSKEADELNEKFKRKFGLVNKMYEIAVTDKKVGFIPMGSNTQQLMLHEEADRCQRDIANALGAQPDLFSQGATFDNKEAAKRATYQDLIIPDAENICQTLTGILGMKDGIHIDLDFTHVSCLQEDRQKNAQSLEQASTALNNLVNGKLLTGKEARTELAKYIDIDPDNPDGEFVEAISSQLGQQAAEGNEGPQSQNPEEITEE